MDLHDASELSITRALGKRRRSDEPANSSHASSAGMAVQSHSSQWLTSVQDAVDADDEADASDDEGDESDAEDDGDADIWEDGPSIEKSADIWEDGPNGTSAILHSGVDVEITVDNPAPRMAPPPTEPEQAKPTTEERKEQRRQQRLEARRVQQMTEETHRVHLQCWLAHGRMLSEQADESLVQSLLLSSVPQEFLANLTPPKLVRLAAWMNASFQIDPTAAAARGGARGGRGRGVGARGRGGGGRTATAAVAAPSMQAQAEEAELLHAWRLIRCALVWWGARE